MRFVKAHNDGFLGRFAYEQVVPQDSSLRKLRDLIDWDRFTDRFVTMYVGKTEHGRPPYHPVLVFKCLLLAYLYKLSERSVEWFCHSTFEGRLFLDVGMSDPTPGHSTPSLFRSRRSRRSRIEAAKEPDGPESKEKRCERMEEQYRYIFDQISQEATRLGIEWGPIRTADSVHTVANVNNDKDRERHERGKPSADPNATVVNKGKRLVTEANGVVEQRKLLHFGYKTHVSQDAETSIVTSIKPTTGSSADNHQMADLIDNAHH